MNIQKKGIKEKIARLSEKDKAYILGYIDRALLEIEDRDKLSKQNGRKKTSVKK